MNEQQLILTARLLKAKQDNLLLKRTIAQNLIIGNNVSNQLKPTSIDKSALEIDSRWKNRKGIIVDSQHSTEQFWENDTSLGLLDQGFSKLLSVKSNLDEDVKMNFQGDIPANNLPISTTGSRASTSTAPAPSKSAGKTEKSNVTHSMQKGAGKMMEISALHKKLKDQKETDSNVEEQGLSEAPSFIPHQFNKKMANLCENVSKAVDDHNKQIASIDQSLLSEEEKRRKKKSEDLKNNRENIEKLCENLESSMALPKWRHKLNGLENPPKEVVIGGARLFRCIVRCMIALIYRPTARMVAKKLSSRDKQKYDLHRSLRIISDVFDEWLGKLVQLPLSTVVTDATLDFAPKETLVGKGAALRSRMLQCKVRLKALVSCICNSSMPNERISNLLVSLVEDDNYFSKDFLFACERSCLDINSLGGTRDMLPVVTDLTAALMAPNTEVMELSVRGESRSFNVYRVKTLIVSFLLIRVFVNHVLLTPWNYGVCAEPANVHVRRVITNCRVVASAVYEMAQRIMESLPEIKSLPKIVTSLSSKKQNKPVAVELTATESKKESAKILSRILHFAGIKDEPGKVTFDSGSIEEHLLSKDRSKFVSLEEMHTMLLSPAELQQIAVYKEQWLEELLPEFRGWVNRLIKHVCEHKLSKAKVI